MIPEGDIDGICQDCEFTFKYSVKPRYTDAEILRKHRCPKCGNFALKKA